MRSHRTSPLVRTGSWHRLRLGLLGHETIPSIAPEPGSTTGSTPETGGAPTHVFPRGIPPTTGFGNFQKAPNRCSSPCVSPLYQNVRRGAWNHYTTVRTGNRRRGVGAGIPICPVDMYAEVHVDPSSHRARAPWSLGRCPWVPPRPRAGRATPRHTPHHPELGDSRSLQKSIYFQSQTGNV